ncbi:MAG: sialate O-acetylesterase [Chthoniobacterales bacterium]
MKSFIPILVLSLALAATTKAELKLPAFFSDHMVLQAGVKTPIWGTASPNEKVTVTLAGVPVTTTAGADGKWRVELPPQKEGLNTDLTLDASGAQTIIHDVLWGEVWLCSGQSNMVRILPLTDNAEQVIAAANDPKIRMFTVERAAAIEPQNDLKGTWRLATPENAKTFSGVAYYFGKKVREVTGNPVGLIVSAYGGTYIECWLDEKTMEADPATKILQDRWNKHVVDLPSELEKYEADMKIWTPEAEKAKAAGQTPPRKPWHPLPADYPLSLNKLYNAMIHPLLGYGIRGFLWYQGETNATGNPNAEYGIAFAGLIKSWRNYWGNDQLPFYFVQLPNYEPPQKQYWPDMRETQRRTLSIPKTGMAITIDVGDPGDVHPKNKKDVGERLARIALANEYGQKIESSGPLIRTAKFSNGKTQLEFDHANGLKTTNGQPPLNFEVGDGTGAFKPATAAIVNNAIVLECAEISAPKFVRYAWVPNPTVNLVNGDGLPAAPFKIDIP